MDFCFGGWNTYFQRNFAKLHCEIPVFGSTVDVFETPVFKILVRTFLDVTMPRMMIGQIGIALRGMYTPQELEVWS